MSDYTPPKLCPVCGDPTSLCMCEGQNQCDGCMAGVPAVNGVHWMGRPGGYGDPMGCTAHLYLRPVFGRTQSDPNSHYRATKERV